MNFNRIYPEIKPVLFFYPHVTHLTFFFNLNYLYTYMQNECNILVQKTFCFHANNLKKKHFNFKHRFCFVTPQINFYPTLIPVLTTQLNQSNFFKLFVLNVLAVKRFLGLRLSKYYPFRLYKLLFGYSQYVLSKLTFIQNYYMFVKVANAPIFQFHKQFDIFLRYRFIFPKNSNHHLSVFEVFYISFKYKNLKFLIIWMKALFKKVNFYKHRYLLYFFRYLFKYLEDGLFKVFKIKGFYMKFHGKIAKAGNSRKQKFLIKYKSVSTSYSTNYVVEKFQMNTFTGVTGVSLILNF